MAHESLPYDVYRARVLCYAATAEKIGRSNGQIALIWLSQRSLDCLGQNKGFEPCFSCTGRGIHC